MPGLVKQIRKILEPPSNVTNFLQKGKLDSFLSSFPANALIADLGSGYKKVSSHCIGVDFVYSGGVDVLGNLFQLPFQDGSLDGVIIRGVLEHVHKPDAAVKEIERILKPGGRVYSSIPFIQGYHPSPGDFQRYTIDGIQNLFKRFEKIDCSITRGAGSAYMWVGREYFSQLFSFNNITMYKFLKVMFGWALQPFKYTDRLVNNHGMAHIAASGFTFIGKKSG